MLNRNSVARDNLEIFVSMVTEKKAMDIVDSTDTLTRPFRPTKEEST